MAVGLLQLPEIRFQFTVNAITHRQAFQERCVEFGLAWRETIVMPQALFSSKNQTGLPKIR